MTNPYLSLSIFVVLAVLTFHQTTLSAQQIKNLGETQVNYIARVTGNIFAEAMKCKYDIQCETKSTNQCDGSNTTELLQNFAPRVGCHNKGSYMSKSSGFRVPGNTEEEILSLKGQICLTATLDAAFRRLYESNNYAIFTKTYVGLANGFFRGFPSHIQTRDPLGGTCKPYDPTVRPWWIASLTGSKHVVVVLDASSSTNQLIYDAVTNTTRTKFQYMREAAKGVLGTLSTIDFVSVIIMRDFSTSLVSTTSKRATQQYLSKLKAELDKVEPSRATDFLEAFDLVYNRFNNPEADVYGSICHKSENVVIMITDETLNYPSFRALPQLKTKLEMLNENSDMKIRLNIYSVLPNKRIENENAVVIPDDQILKVRQGFKQLGCNFQGSAAFFNQSNIGEMKKQVKRYHIKLAQLLEVQSPIWTQPYDDAFGYGSMITATKPIYVCFNLTEGGEYITGPDSCEDKSYVYRYIIGTAGVDIPLGSLQDNLQNLVINENKCNVTKFREASCQQGAQLPEYKRVVCHVNTTVFVSPPMEFEDKQCVGITSLQFKIILGVTISSFVLIALASCIGIYKAYHHFRKKPDRVPNIQNRDGGTGSGSDTDPHRLSQQDSSSLVKVQASSRRSMGPQENQRQQIKHDSQ